MAALSAAVFPLSAKNRWWDIMPPSMQVRVVPNMAIFENQFVVVVVFPASVLKPYRGRPLQPPQPPEMVHQPAWVAQGLPHCWVISTVNVPAEEGPSWAGGEEVLQSLLLFFTFRADVVLHLADSLPV